MNLTPASFYVSARFGRQAEARRVADSITELTGWRSNSRWLDDTPENDVAIHRHLSLSALAARSDFDDIARSDFVVCLTEAVDPVLFRDPTGEPLVPASAARGGRHVEVGFAIAKGIPVFTIGPRENLFHALCYPADNVEHVVEKVRHYLPWVTNGPMPPGRSGV